MRLGTASQVEFIKKLNSKNSEIQETYQKHMSELTKTIKAKVMMGDSTITEQNTFEPQKVHQYYTSIVSKLDSWSIQDISESNNEDLRRIFTKFEIKEGNYLLSGHMSIQFHVLLYYKPDYRVVECQKELADIIKKTETSEFELAEMSEEYVKTKLKDSGHNNLDHQELFEVLYKNDEIRDEIYKKIEQNADHDVLDAAKKKSALIKELDNLLIETYQTTSVLIDDTRLVSGEEGILCTFDIEFIKDGVREGLFDAKKIPQRTQDAIFGHLENFSKLVNT